MPRGTTFAAARPGHTCATKRLVAWRIEPLTTRLRLKVGEGTEERRATPLSLQNGQVEQF